MGFSNSPQVAYDPLRHLVVSQHTTMEDDEEDEYLMRALYGPFEICRRKYENWMAELPPELHDIPLNCLSIPGSID